MRGRTSWHLSARAISPLWVRRHHTSRYGVGWRRRDCKLLAQLWMLEGLIGGCTMLPRCMKLLVVSRVFLVYRMRPVLYRLAGRL